jgi:hypothetical protein
MDKRIEATVQELRNTGDDYLELYLYKTEEWLATPNPDIRAGYTISWEYKAGMYAYILELKKQLQEATASKRGYSFL